MHVRLVSARAAAGLVASLVLLLGAAQAAPALDHGSQTPRARNGGIRRDSDSLSAHASRSTIVDNLLVVDAATSAPWTGFAADGGEIEMMPARLLVSFELHGEPQLLHVARTDAFVSSNCRFPSHKLRSNFSFRGVGVVGVRHGDCPACMSRTLQLCGVDVRTCGPSTTPIFPKMLLALS